MPKYYLQLGEFFIANQTSLATREITKVLINCLDSCPNIPEYYLQLESIYVSKLTVTEDKGNLDIWQNIYNLY